MTTIASHPIERFAASKHHVITTAALVLLFWLIAALLVMGVNSALVRVTPGAAAVVKIAAIVSAAFGYMRLTARNATVDHALLVGLVWLLLDVGAEIAVARFALLGTPARPAMRDVLLLAWIIAPALFARSASDAAP
ncbi:MAG TPA: hypothetical protein VMU84_11400 [Thermoanaerobaculia bacterium]|nr:hypothetical protein [Thermoanaerobaculia bacterium]